MGTYLKKQRELQFQHQSGLCCWCLQPMELVNVGGYGQQNPVAASWEHILPKSLGGVNARRNRVLAHSACNKKRGNSIRSPHFMPYPGRGETGNHRSQLPQEQLQRISPCTEGSNPSGPTT